jgi:hypothetical protein
MPYSFFTMVLFLFRPRANPFIVAVKPTTTETPNMGVGDAPLPGMASVRTTEEVELDAARRSRKEAEELATGETTRRKPRRWKARLMKRLLKSPLKRPKLSWKNLK